MKVKELLADEKAWTRWAFARDAEGNAVSPESRDACRFCLLGAIRRCYAGDHDGMWAAMDRLRQVIPAGDAHEISEFNDLPGTTHAAVLAVVQEANI
jgi:hypothetical protein